MAKKTNNQATKRPRPPEELDGEALLEWHRLCDELESVDRLEATDRGIIQLAAQAYANWVQATKHVETYGLVVKAHNGVAQRNPYYAIQIEQADRRRGLLADLGLTPVTRLKNAKANASKDDDGGDLDF